MKIAYFDCFSGISGDMVLGAFLDAGLSINTLSRELKKLGLKGYELKKSRVRRGELTGIKFDIVIKPRQDEHPSRPLNEILRLIDKSSLKNSVKETAKDIFSSIGKAESRVHGIDDAKKVHLHELSGMDSIIDIVGAAIAFDELGIDEVYSSAIHFGRALARTKGGVLPMPSPASVELLKGVPARISNIEAELVTPTGAGILKAMSKGFGGMPQMKIASVGYGAGAKNLSELPNMLRVMIGEKQGSFFKEDRVFVIETHIDDMNPQNFEYLFEKLFKEGALDVCTESIQMKKTRPAFKLTVLCDSVKLQKMCSIIFSETTSIGIRYYEASRYKLERRTVKVNTKYGNVKVKLSGLEGGILNVSPEYDECVKLARKTKVPLKKVYEEAKNAIGA